MRRYTAKDIALFIINSDHLMFEEGRYWVHTDYNGNLMYSWEDSDKTFSACFDASEWAEDESPDRFYEEAETLENKDFVDTCQELADDINEYINRYF